jgi:hypothetical protein
MERKKNKPLTLNDRVVLLRKHKELSLTLSTVENLMEYVMPRLIAADEFEVCIEMKAILTQARKKDKRQATLIKNAGLSNIELKKMLHLPNIKPKLENGKGKRHT